MLASCGTAPKEKAGSAADHVRGVRIGDQFWQAKNLDVAVFRNGDAIPEVKSHQEWEQAGKDGKPAWCYYHNDRALGRHYGRLYNWHAVNDPRGLAPKGWHVPTNDDWNLLEWHLGGAGAGGRLKCNVGWNNGGNGSNDSKFCALPGGYRDRNGSFIGAGEDTYFTGSTTGYTEDKKQFIWGRGLHFADRILHRCGLHKEFGMSGEGSFPSQLHGESLNVLELQRQERSHDQAGAHLFLDVREDLKLFADTCVVLGIGGEFEHLSRPFVLHQKHHGDGTASQATLELVSAERRGEQVPATPALALG